MRFCKLPEKSIFSFLNDIQQKENLHISKEHLTSIIILFKSGAGILPVKASVYNFVKSVCNTP